ncbi:MAG: cell surface protein SprA [Agriterribacter sp.]
MAEENNMDFSLDVLTSLKSERNNLMLSTAAIYRKEVNGRTYSVMGNPNFGEVSGFLFGVENPGSSSQGSVCTEVWINELRLSDIDEKGGWAALGRVDFNLADLGNITLSGSMHTAGFGTIEQGITERSMDNFSQIDAVTNLQLGKLLPKSAGLEIPFYAGYSSSKSTPEYDPYDKDITLKDKLKTASPEDRDSIRNAAMDVTVTKTISFTNVRKTQKEGTKIKPWSISNFSYNYAYTETAHHSPVLESSESKKTKTNLAYNYSNQPRFVEPFKKLIRSKSPWLSMIKEFNINFRPSLLNVNWDVTRQFAASRSREVYVPGSAVSNYKIPETFTKLFTFDRTYNFRWDVSKSLNIDFSAINNARIDEPDGRLDNKAKKDSVRSNFFKGGRTTFYTQATGITYVLPANKLPALDWTAANVSYKTTYSWTAASRAAISLGNILQNSNAASATIDLDFQRLYDKWHFLKRMDKGEEAAVAKDTSKVKKGAINKEEKERKETQAWIKAAAKIFTSLKRMNISYSAGSSSYIPGYMDSTKAFGQNWKTNAPGLGYIFGKLPDSTWLNRAAKKGWISTDSLQNTLTSLTYNQQYTITAQLEPVRDLQININLSKTFNKSYSELFKDTLRTGVLEHLNAYSAGGFSISYISLQTLFQKTKQGAISKTFQQFQDYRKILSARLGSLNPYSQVKGDDGYYMGYGQYAQDVLIPSFLAAYTGKSADKISLIKTGNSNVTSNPFSGYLPKPNWNLTYNGLSRINALAKIFTSFSIRHGYSSTLSMNSFSSNLNYDDLWKLGYPSFIDTTSGSFIPYFLIPNITIQEQFAPLIGVDASFTNQLSVRMEYIKSRTLTLSLTDYQVSEIKSTGFTTSASWRLTKVNLPFRINFLKKGGDGKTTSDIKFSFDFSLRDDITSNSYLDQTTSYTTSGQKVILISPSVDLVLSNRIQLKFYYDQQRSIPYISTSSPTVTTKAGVTVNVSLAQ